MNLAVTLEAGAAVVVILTGFGALVVWSVKRIVELGSLFSAIPANTTATKELTQAMGDLKDMVANHERRIEALESRNGTPRRGMNVQ